MVLIEAIKYFVQRLLKQLYWLYQLQVSCLGQNIKLDFPIILEGRGELKLGSNSSIKKYAAIKKGKGSKIVIGDHGFLDKDSTILTSENSSLLIGNSFKLGEGARLYVGNQWEFGNDVKIETHCSIFSRESGFYGRLDVKNGTHIGDYTIIDVTDDVLIGNDVAIGPNCVIYTHDHNYTHKDKAAWKGGVYTKSVRIKDGAWVGSGVTILPGVTIGERCVVAAGSVVTKDLEDNSVYGGIPAKLIKVI